MVKTSEQTHSDTVINTIAVKLPDELQSRVLSFAFLHALRDLYPNADVHLISSKNGIEILNLLPQKKFFYHEIETDELKSIFDVHRYCAEVKIYNTDLFICLTTSFIDSAIGLGLRAKQRVGFNKGLNSFLLNKSYSWKNGQHVIENFYQLIDFDSQKPIKIYSRELKPIIEGESSYLAFNVGPLKNGMIDEVWLKVCDHLQNQNIVFFMDLIEDKYILNHKEFMSRLNSKNTYRFFVAENYIELARMMAFSQGVITRNGVVSCLSAYTSTPTIILNDREDPRIWGPFHFLSDLKMIELEFKAAGDKLDNPASFNAESVALSAHDFFKLYI